MAIVSYVCIFKKSRPVLGGAERLFESEEYPYGLVVVDVEAGVVDGGVTVTESRTVSKIVSSAARSNSFTLPSAG